MRALGQLTKGLHRLILVAINDWTEEQIGSMIRLDKLILEGSKIQPPVCSFISD